MEMISEGVKALVFGMAGIFVVMGVIISVVVLINRLDGIKR